MNSKRINPPATRLPVRDRLFVAPEQTLTRFDSRDDRPSESQSNGLFGRLVRAKALKRLITLLAMPGMMPSIAPMPWTSVEQVSAVWKGEDRGIELGQGGRR